MIEYDKTADALYLRLQKNKKVARTREIEDGLVVDLDNKGKVIGIEILDVSSRYSLISNHPFFFPGISQEIKSPNFYF